MRETDKENEVPFYLVCLPHFTVVPSPAYMWGGHCKDWATAPLLPWLLHTASVVGRVWEKEDKLSRSGVMVWLASDQASKSLFQGASELTGPVWSMASVLGGSWQEGFLRERRAHPSWDV